MREQLEQIIDDWKAAVADGKLMPHEYLKLAADGCAVVEGVLRGIGGDEIAFNQFVSECEGLVQDHIVPLDLSKYGVPKMVERLVIDPQLVPTIRPTLEVIRSKIVGDSPST